MQNHHAPVSLAPNEALILVNDCLSADLPIRLIADELLGEPSPLALSLIRDCGGWDVRAGVAAEFAWLADRWLPMLAALWMLDMIVFEDETSEKLRQLLYDTPYASLRRAEYERAAEDLDGALPDNWCSEVLRRARLLAFTESRQEINLLARDVVRAKTAGLAAALSGDEEHVGIEECAEEAFGDFWRVLKLQLDARIHTGLLLNQE